MVWVFFMHPRAVQGRSNLTFKTMSSIPPIMWVCYFTSLLESFAYYAFIFVFVIFLVEDHNFSDLNAARAYAIFGTMSVLFSSSSSLLVGETGYNFWASIFGYFFVSLARLTLTFTVDLTYMASIVFFLLPIGSAFNVGQSQVAIRKFTKDNNRMFAIAAFEVVDSLGGLLAGLAVDTIRFFVRVGVDMPAIDTSGMFVAHLSKYQLILFAGSIASIIVFLVNVLIIGDLEYKPEEPPEDELIQETPFQYLRRLARDYRFWVLIVMSVGIVGVRVPHRHLEITMPLYMHRYFGPESPWGTVLAIPRMATVVFSPVLRTLSYKMNPYTGLLTGSLIVMFGPWLLAFIQNYYTVAAFGLLLCAGEETWNCQVVSCCVMVSQENQALAKVFTRICLISTSLFAIIVAGIEAGYMLEAFCPAVGPKHTGTIWLMAAIPPTVGVLILLLIRVAVPKLRVQGKVISFSGVKNKGVYDGIPSDESSALLGSQQNPRNDETAQ